MSVNVYLQRLALHSPNKAVASVAKNIGKVGKVADNLVGASTRRSAAQAGIATRVAYNNPTKHNTRFSDKLQQVAVREAKRTKNTRLAAGLVAGGSMVAHKALQKSEDDVYYGSY